MIEKDLPLGASSNEGFFTGAMCDAMNSFLEGGFTVLHQACLGIGSTHSDLSASRVERTGLKRTLMVGEGKWETTNLREETRGQLLNELLRHRLIDSSQTRTPIPNHTPVLLLAFDLHHVEIDVAFPSTKGGKLDLDGVVNFSGTINNGTETFWTVQLLQTSITNLPVIFRFIADALEFFYDSPFPRRVQFKIPMPIPNDDGITSSAIKGDNVTIVERNGSRRVYKEYCYHLRETSNFFTPTIEIGTDDQRQPPPRELLDALGAPYNNWTIDRGPFGTCVLSYDCIEGSADKPSVGGWLMIIRQIGVMHGKGYVHGDLLPRNVLFKGDEGFVIDFDLSRKIGKPYVEGFNHGDFMDFRHKRANRWEPMLEEHDVHSLYQMSKHFFAVPSLEEPRALEDLERFFEDNRECPISQAYVKLGATGSPR